MGRKGAKKTTKDSQEETENYSINISALEKEEMELDLQIRRARIEKKKQELSNLSNNANNAESTEKIEVTEEKEPTLPTLNDLAKNRSLEDALACLKDSHLDFISTQKDAIQHGSANSSQDISTSGKFPCITDHVMKPNQSSASANDKTKHLEDVSPAQWISANVRILQQLIKEGLDVAGILSYLRYTAKIGDYLQMSDQSSVMLLDHEHRRQVHQEGRDWDNIDGDKVYFHLKAPTSKPHARSFVSTDEKGRPICKRFNKGICFSSFCRYAHICFVCKGDHPKMAHPNQPQMPPQMTSTFNSTTTPAPPTMPSFQQQQPPRFRQL